MRLESSWLCTAGLVPPPKISANPKLVRKSISYPNYVTGDDDRSNKPATTRRADEVRELAAPLLMVCRNVKIVEVLKERGFDFHGLSLWRSKQIISQLRTELNIPPWTLKKQVFLLFDEGHSQKVVKKMRSDSDPSLIKNIYYAWCRENNITLRRKKKKSV